MINVSNEFKTNIKKPVRRLGGFAELIVNGSYFDVKETGENYRITATNKADITSLDSLADSDPAFYRYGSLENNYFILDGSMILPNRDYTNKNTGYICSDVGDTTTIEINIPVSLGLLRFMYLRNITIYFDEEYATDFNIEIDGYYADGTNSKTKTYTINYTNNEKTTITTDETIIPKIINEDGSSYVFYTMTGIRINITGWSNSEHRIRIKQINAGESILYEKNDLIELDVNEESSLDNMDIPNNDCSVVLNNYDGKYNVIEPNSLLNRINKDSYIRIGVGVSIGGGIEYVNMGVYHYTSYTDNRDKTITLYGTGSIEDYSSQKQFLYNYGLPEATVKTVASSILNQSQNKNEVNYNGIVHLEKSNFENEREQLQALAIFASSIVKESRDFTVSRKKNIAFLTKENNIVATTINLDEQLKFPKIIRKNKIKSVVINSQKNGNLNNEKKVLLEDSSTSVPMIYSIGGSAQTEYICDFYLKNRNPIDLSTIEITVKENDEEMQTVDYFVYNSETQPQIRIFGLKANSNVSIKVLGKEYDSNQLSSIYENSKVDSGETIELTNNLLTNNYHRNRVAKFIFETQKDYEFEIEFNGDPSIEVGDTILFETEYGYMRGWIGSIATKFNGSLNQVIKGVCNRVLQ